MPNISVRRKRLLDGHLSPGQCRAARGFLGLSQEALGAAAGISGMTIQSFERGQRVPHQNNLVALRTVLEAKGVQFLSAEDGADGVLLPFDMLPSLHKDDEETQPT